MPGLHRAQSLSPLERLQVLKESGLAECGPAGEPIHLAWREFLRGHGPSVLVIDATELDPRGLGPGAVLDGAPWLLAEGVLIAAGLRDSHKIELRLPAELQGHEAALSQRGRRDPVARADRHARPPDRGATELHTGLLGRRTSKRPRTTDPHA